MVIYYLARGITHARSRKKEKRKEKRKERKKKKRKEEGWPLKAIRPR